jgi:tetrapyrrole methylase family protein/MazG family protein
VPATVRVVGLGPAGPDLINAATRRAIDATPVRYLRTIRHPAATAVPNAETFDGLYESAATIDAVYTAIVEALVLAAERYERVLYAVPGSPAVAERSVELLLADDRVDTEVVAAMSCIDLAWVRLGVDPLAAGARIVDGHRYAEERVVGNALVLQCDRPDVLSDIKVSLDGGEVVVLHHLGLPDERVQAVPWHELDRFPADHLSSVWLTAPPDPLRSFQDLVRTLRRDCPWDRAQTHESLRPYVVEEAYEVVEAIDTGVAELLEEELGDLLFQVYIHATLAEETGVFVLDDVVRGIHDKLVRRHPHVFGGEPVPWEELKRREKPVAGVFDGVTVAQPALSLADQLQKRAAALGFDWPDVEGAWPKIIEELEELRAATTDEQAGELGDLLFACVNVARHLRIDPEQALRDAARKFRARFEEVERRRVERGLSSNARDQLWDEVKRDGR